MAPVPLGPAALAAGAAAAAVGLFGPFGSGDDDRGGDGGDDEVVEALAARLGTRPDPDAVAGRLDDLLAATETLASTAAADPRISVGPGDDVVRQARELARAVDRGDATVTAPGAAGGSPGSPGGPDGPDGAALADAADRVERRQAPASPAARDLLAAVRDGRDPEGALADAVAALEERHAVAEAVSAVPPEASDADDRLRRHLDGADGDLAAGVRSLADALGTARRRATDLESERRELADAVERVGTAAAKATDAAVDPAGEGTPADRARALVDAVESGELAFGDADGDVAEAAARVRRRESPESRVAGRLLDALAAPGGSDDLEGPLASAASALDRGATDRSVAGDVDPGAVADLADDVAGRLAGRDGPVAAALARRVEDLRAMLDRADDANTVVPYAVREELRFYDRTLLDALDGPAGDAAGAGAGRAGRSAGSSGTNAAGSGADAEEVRALLDDLADRREHVEETFVDGRPDHNHSIPLHFLDLADDLHEAATERAEAGEPGAARGLASAVEDLLAHVEDLYERNAYSVMLRRLRG